MSNRKFNQINQSMSSTIKDLNGNVVKPQSKPVFYTTKELKIDGTYMDVLSQQAVLCVLEDPLDGEDVKCVYFNRITGLYEEFRPYNNQMYRVL